MGGVINKLLGEDDIVGYHILNICDDSPAQVVGLEAYFDFIVMICGVRLDGCHNVLLNLLHQSAGKPIIMNVYSFRNREFRDVKITPNLEWGIQGLLGVTIRFCSAKEAYNNVYHILEVHPGSPADQAGLHSFSDYIIGAEVHTESNDINFIALIKGYDGRELKLFLYNHDDDACRSVLIKPNSKWGGEGFIGCGIGNGYLHRIPTEVNNRFASKICNTIVETALSIEIEKTSPTLLYVPPLKKTLEHTEVEIDLEANNQMEIFEKIHNSSENVVENVCNSSKNSCLEFDVERRDGNDTKYLMMIP